MTRFRRLSTDFAAGALLSQGSAHIARQPQSTALSQADFAAGATLLQGRPDFVAGEPLPQGQAQISWQAQQFGTAWASERDSASHISSSKRCRPSRKETEDGHIDTQSQRESHVRMYVCMYACMYV